MVVVIGAHVEGFAALVVDRLLAAHLPRVLGAMSAEQRREVELARREVRAAADWWLASTRVVAAGGNAEGVGAEIEAGSSVNDEIDVATAVRLLGCGARRVRQLAAGWEPQGLARKVGQSWLLDRTAVEARRVDLRRSA